MPRLPGNVVPGQALHVIQRGNNRQAIYFSESDYRYFRESLRAAAEKYRCSIHACVFMTNHVHLLVTPETQTGLSQMANQVL